LGFGVGEFGGEDEGVEGDVAFDAVGVEEGHQAGQVFFGVGAPDFQGDPSDDRTLDAGSVYTAGAVDVEKLRRLRRLDGAKEELESLALSFGAKPSDVLIGAAATESAVKARNDDGSLARADVISFATHGLVAGSFEGTLTQPALALSPPRSASTRDDGLLVASEIALFSLRARWVILSACDTASGGKPDAEGLSGLARAFFVAGARTLLVSLWPVDDAGSARLVSEAVKLQTEAKGVEAQRSAAEHMRQAMRKLALTPDKVRDEGGESFAHPRVWAPFILVSGD
jgi:CHAT domain-containing protein